MSEVFILSVFIFRRLVILTESIWKNGLKYDQKNSQRRTRTLKLDRKITPTNINRRTWPKYMISTCKRHAEHLFAGRNTQQSNFTPDQSWPEPNRNDPIYTIKMPSRRYQKGVTSYWRTDKKAWVVLASDGYFFLSKKHAFYYFTLVQEVWIIPSIKKFLFCKKLL